LFNRIRKMGYEPEITDSAKDFIVDKGWDEQFGARPLKRAIQKYIEDTLAEEIIKTTLKTGDGILIDFNKETNDIVIQVVPSIAVQNTPVEE
jgi:ATP-dependent Clp protease ATP-binding subunit ClpC